MAAVIAIQTPTTTKKNILDNAVNRIWRGIGKGKIGECVIGEEVQEEVTKVFVKKPLALPRSAKEPKDQN